MSVEPGKIDPVNPDSVFLQPSTGGVTPVSPAPAGEPLGSSGTPAGVLPSPSDPSSAPIISDAGLAQARELGLDVTAFKDDRELVRALVDHIQSQQDYARIGVQAAVDWDAYQSWRTDQARTPQPQPASKEFDEEAHFNTAWPVPPWDSTWDAAERRGFVERNTQGHWQPCRGHEISAASLARDMNAHEAARASAIESLLVKGNPIRVIHDQLVPLIERRTRQMVDELVGAKLMDREYKAKVAELDHTFAPYAKTEWGQAALKHFDKLKAAGMTDLLVAWDTAMALAGARPTTPTPAPAAPVAPSSGLPPLPPGYTYTIRDAGNRILSADEASALQKQSFLEKAIQASHDPGTHVTRPDMYTRGIPTEAQMNNYFLESPAS